MSRADNPSVAGIGIDLADIGWFRERGPAAYPSFYALAFTADERRRCDAAPDPPATFAAHFAAKEASVKALGASGVAVAVPQVEANVEAGTARVVSRRGETVPAAARELSLRVTVETRPDGAAAAFAAATLCRYPLRANVAVCATG